MSIRPARLNDFSLLKTLEQASFSDPWGDTGLIEELEVHHEEGFHRVYFYEEEGITKAYLIGFRLEDEWQIYRIAVLPSYRQQGIASKFLRGMLQLARQAGIVKCTLEARENNVAALALYRKLGFIEVGRRPNFYRDTGEAAVLLDSDLEERDDEDE